jgi:hypothetical protein
MNKFATLAAVLLLGAVAGGPAAVAQTAEPVFQACPGTSPVQL